MKLQRYEFEDALIKWGQEQGTRKAYFAVNNALRLCSQLNWSRGGVLRYNTLSACEQAGIARSSYYRQMPYLVEAGFFYLDTDQNYRACIPVSSTETDVSLTETDVSSGETDMSQQDNPFSTVLFTDIEANEEPSGSLGPLKDDARVEPINREQVKVKIDDDQWTLFKLLLPHQNGIDFDFAVGALRNRHCNVENLLVSMRERAEA